MSHEIIYVGVVFGLIAGTSRWIRARARRIGDAFRRKKHES